MSSSSEEGGEDPLINYDTSKGSSVSSGLQEEYNELLKYAIVTPKWEPHSGIEQKTLLPQLKLCEPEDRPLTTMDEFSEESSRSSESNDGHDSAMGSDEVTSDRRSFREPPVIERKQSVREPSAEERKLSIQESFITERKFSAKDPFAKERKFSVKEPFAMERKFSVKEPFEKERKVSIRKPSPSGSPLEYRVSSIMSSPLKHTSHHDDNDVIDPDFIRANNKLVESNYKLKQMVLAEMAQLKLDLSEQYRRLLHSKEQEIEAEAKNLQDEVENMKELLHNYEISLARKNGVIINLTRGLQISKEKQALARALGIWRARLNDERRQSFTTNLAKSHYENGLKARAWQSWRSCVEGKWREKVEKACQNKAEEICLLLTKDHDAKIESLNAMLEASRGEIELLQKDRAKYEETMKKAFMRGVCALNLEAMTMFEKGDRDASQFQTIAAAVDSLSHEVEARNDIAKPDPDFDVMSVVSASIKRGQPHAHLNRPAPSMVIPTGFNVHNPPPQTVQANRTVNPKMFLRDQPHAPNAFLPQGYIPPKVLKKPRRNQRNSIRSHSISHERPKSTPPSQMVVVKRHHPNIQNYATNQPLKHVAKYPNTPNKPIP